MAVLVSAVDSCHCHDCRRASGSIFWFCYYSPVVELLVLLLCILTCKQVFRLRLSHQGTQTSNSVVYSIRVRVYNIRVAPLRTMPLHDARCCAAPFASSRISFAPIEQCSIFCARPRDFAAGSLAFASKIGSFQCFRPKRTVENFSPNQWVLLSFIFFLFLHFFRCFSGENDSFVLQIVQFSRTWCSNHFVSYFGNPNIACVEVFQ